MAFKFNALTGNFDIVTQTEDIDFSAIQAQIDALSNRVDNVEDEIEILQTYSQTFTITSWLGPTSGQYYLTVPQSAHNKENPVVQVYELIAGNYQQIDCLISINDSTKEVKISVNQTPDLRFNGKILIS